MSRTNNDSKFTDIFSKTNIEPPMFRGYENFIRQHISRGCLDSSNWRPPNGCGHESILRIWSDDPCYDIHRDCQDMTWTMTLMDYDHGDGRYNPNAQTNVHCTVHSVKMEFQLYNPTFVTIELESWAYFREYNNRFPKFSYKYNIDTTEEQYFQRSLVEEMDLDYNTHRELIHHMMAIIEDMQNVCI